MHRLQPLPRQLPGPDSPQGGVKWRQDECHMCLNCGTSCLEDVIGSAGCPTAGARRWRRPTWTNEALVTLAGRRRGAPARPHQRHDRDSTITTASSAAGLGARARLHGALYPLRRCMKMCQQRAPPGLPGGGVETLDARSSSRASGRALRACSAARCARPARSRRSPRCRSSATRFATSSPSRSGRPSTTTGAACRGRWRRPASCASSADVAEGDLGGGGRTRPTATATRFVQRPHVDPQLCIGMRRLREGAPGARPARGGASPRWASRAARPTSSCWRRAAQPVAARRRAAVGAVLLHATAIDHEGPSHAARCP